MIDTPSRLITAARSCVAEHGIAGTTSRAITAEAGANLAAITYHFESKDALVVEALLSGVRDWLRPALDAFGGDDDPIVRSLSGIQRLIEGYAAHREFAPALLEALVCAPHFPELHKGILDLWDEVRTRLTDDMTKMIERGDLPGWVDATVMATLFMAVAQGLVLQTTVDSDGPDLASMAGQFALLLLAARSQSTERKSEEKS